MWSVIKTRKSTITLRRTCVTISQNTEAPQKPSRILYKSDRLVINATLPYNFLCLNGRLRLKSHRRIFREKNWLNHRNWV